MRAFDDGPCSSSSFSMSRSPQWMPSSRLVSQVESSSSRNGGAFSRLSRKKKKVFGSLVRRIWGAAMRAKTARAMRSSFQLMESPSMRRKRVDRCHRSPGTSLTRIDADPSWRRTRSMPPWRRASAGPCGRARATMMKMQATIRQSQKGSSPATAKRERMGSVAVLEDAAGIATARRESPHPREQQQRRDGQQPEVIRRAECDLPELDARQHDPILPPAARRRSAPGIGFFALVVRHRGERLELIARNVGRRTARVAVNRRPGRQIDAEHLVLDLGQALRRTIARAHLGQPVTELHDVLVVVRGVGAARVAAQHIGVGVDDAVEALDDGGCRRDGSGWRGTRRSPG